MTRSKKMWFCVLFVSMVNIQSIVSEEKWVWGDRDKEARIDRVDDARYLVQENPDFNIGVFRPQNNGPHGPFGRPLAPNYQDNSNGILVGPDGPTGIIVRPGSRNPGDIPPWIKNQPRFPNFDTCGCKYSLNCPGKSFGSCGGGKKYCCYDSRKYPQVGRPHGVGPRPFYPESSAHRPLYQGFGSSFDYYGNREPHEILPGGHRDPFQGSRYPNGDDLNFQRPQDRPYLEQSGFGIHTIQPGKIDAYDNVDQFSRSSKDNNKE